MKDIANLALAGHEPLFDSILPVGQLYSPSKERFHSVFHDLFDRRYYTNHGKLAQELERRLEERLDVRNAVVVTNATLGLSLSCKALGLPPQGKVIVPAFTFAATVQALTWAGLEPVFCDISNKSHNLDPQKVAALLEQHDVCAILGVHLWGNPCDIEQLQTLADSKGIPLFFDAAHAIACRYHGKPIGNFGACEVFSFHATKIMNATEGGCITTNDDELAERLRNLRSSYGRRKNVKTPIDGYGRFSEAQAAFGLLSLEDLSRRCDENCQKMALYHKKLSCIPGIHCISPAPEENMNYQYVVLEIDEKEFGLSRDALQKLLEAENVIARRYFVPGMHHCPPYETLFPEFATALPVTDALCTKVLQLPSGAPVSMDAVSRICECIAFVQANSADIKRTYFA